MIKRLSDLVDEVKGAEQKTLVVAAGQDPNTLDAIAHAVRQGVVKAILVGDRIEIEEESDRLAIDHTCFDIVHVKDPKEAAYKAVQMIHEGRAQMLMKGIVKTSDYMKAILDKEKGLLPKGGLLTHMALMEIPSYPKLLIVTDAAIIPAPDLDQKIQILNYAIQIANAIGIETPKAALVSATETINFKMQSSMDAAVIKVMSQRKQIQGAVVDGPLALDVSLSPKHCEIKELDSPINGEADILLFPNIETANTFYKSVTLLAHGQTASIVTGTTAPVVLTSRADEEDSKFYSIVMAARMAQFEHSQKREIDG